MLFADVKIQIILTTLNVYKIFNYGGRGGVEYVHIYEMLKPKLQKCFNWKRLVWLDGLMNANVFDICT